LLGKVDINLDIHTFTQNVLKNETTMYRVAKSILPNDADCEDAVSEALLKGYAKLYMLREESFFKTWLIRILINECYKIRREKKVAVDLQSCEEILPVYDAEYDPMLHEAIMNLPSKMRMVIVLYYIEGYAVNEIKSILHIPSGTVKSRLSRGRQLLKEHIESEEV